MVIDNDSPPANPVADFEDFFRNFEDVPNEFKYRVKITQSYAKSENYITILFEDILNYQPILANYLKKNPEQALKDAAEAFKTIYRIDAGGDFNPDQEFFVRISTQNNSNEISLREIRSIHIDNLIYVKGIIIRASVVRPQIQTATFECPICGTIMQIDQDTSKLEAPRECENPACKNKKDFKVLTDDSIFIDQQSITIQEPPEDLRSGSIPQTLHTILTQKLVDSVRPGEHVKIMGILKSVPKEDNRGRLSTVFQTFLMANNIEGVKQEEEDQNLTQDDVNEILALAKEPGIQNKIARSIARGILGHDKLKMAAALSLFGGNQKLKKDGSKLRGDIHVLFMGDPGTGKSQILQNAAQIAPRSIYTSGKGASAAGLTAAVIKESNSTGLQLEAGALVLASGGVACIDEFDKMRNQDRSAIHEAMEQQTVSIAKAGIVATLQAKTAIIAAANPKNGRWNEYESSSANINLSPPLLSRFDLIFVVRDIPDRNNDDRIAEYILQNHMEGYSDTFTEDADGKAKSDPKFDFVKMNLLKKYISYAKNNFHPRLSKEAMLAIQKFYVDTRNANTEDPNTISIVARNLDGMVRLCESYAKMALRDYVTLIDAQTMIDLQKKSLKDIGYDEETGKIDMDRMFTGTTSNKRNHLNKILSRINTLQTSNPSQPISFEDIYEPLANEEGITEEFVIEALQHWRGDGTIICPREGQYKLVKLLRKSKK